jgi:hypothetical protein
MTTLEYTPRLESLANDAQLSERALNGADDIRIEPSFPKATTILFNSGNVVQSDRLKKRTNLNPQEEVLTLIKYL